MKRNKLFLLGLFVVFAAVLSLSLVSSTFAKYTSSESAADTARVAKWGVTVEVTGDDAFGEKYDDAIEAAGTKVVSVGASNDSVEDNVLAPGTNGTLGGIAIAGTPEVMVTVKLALDIELGDNWEDELGNFYCPLVFKVGSTTIDSTGCADADAFEAKIEAAVAYALAVADADPSLEGYQVAANTALTYSVSMTWEWAFETGADEATKAANNIKDTYLGTQGLANISTSWTASVEQID